MPLTELQKALQEPGARAINAIILRPIDPAQDNAEVVELISDGDLWVNTAGIVPAGNSFRKVIAEGGAPSLTESLTQPMQLTGQSQFTAGTMTVDADDDMVSRWGDLLWNGRPFDWYLGVQFGTAGQRLGLDDFELALSGLIDKVRPIGDRQYEITFVGRRKDLEKNLVEDIYLGFGGGFAIRYVAESGAYLHADHSATMDLTGDMSIDWVGRVEQFASPPPNNGAYFPPLPLLMNGDSGLSGTPELDCNYGLFMDEATHKLGFGSADEVVLSTFTIPEDGPVFMAASVTGTTVSFFAAIYPADVLPVGTATLTLAPTPGSTHGLHIGQPDGSFLIPWEVRLSDIPLTLDDFIDRAKGPMMDADTRDGIVEVWRFSEGVQLGVGNPVVFGEKEAIDLDALGPGPIEWVSTFEGDDPDLFSGGPAGNTKAATYGFANNVPLVRLDTQRRLWSWDHEPRVDALVWTYDRFRMRGVPLVPDWSVTAGNSGDFVFDDAGTVTITNGALPGFEKFIAGQISPARLGQRIVVTGTGSANDGVFRIGIGGISADGRSMTLVDRAVIDQSAPADTVIASYSADIQLEAHPEGSYIELLADPTGDVTADLYGRIGAAGKARWDELFEMITGIAVTAASFNPVLGFHLPPGGNLTKNAALDELARSAFGWWVETPEAAGYRLGNFTPPGGGPSVASVSVSSLGSDHVGVVTPLDSVDPYWQFKIGYAKNWKTQTDGLGTSVSPADAQRFAAEYSWEPSTDRSVLGDYPLATAHPGFTTWLTERDDVLTFKALAKAMIGVKRRWYQIDWPTFWPWHIRPGDEIAVTWDDPTVPLNSTPCRVTSRSVDAAGYSISLVVHD